ncbi:hypothetical protein [Burkholderia territorii]
MITTLPGKLPGSVNIRVHLSVLRDTVLRMQVEAALVQIDADQRNRS